MQLRGSGGTSTAAAPTNALFQGSCGTNRRRGSRSGLGLGRVRRLLHRRLLRTLASCSCCGFRDINASFEVSSILNDDAAGFDIPYKLGFFFDVDLVGSIDVALDRSMDDDLASLKTSLHARIGADCEPVFLALNGAFDFAVNCQIFSSEDLALNGHILTECSRAAPW